MRALGSFVAVASLAAFAQPAEPGDVADEDVLDPGFERLQNPAFPSPQVKMVPIDRGPKVERADLAPYFEKGKLAEARAAFDAGKYEVAKAILDGQGNAVWVRYLRGVIALKQSDFALAATTFEKLAEDYPALRDRVLLAAGQAAEAAKDFDTAARVYARVAPTARASGDARLGLGRALRQLKRFDDAKAAVASLAERGPPPWGRDLGAEALWVVADIAQARRDAQGERDALLELWSRHPMAPLASKAEGRISDFSQLPVDARIARAEGLIEAHQNAAGVRILEAWVPSLKIPEPLACRANLALGKGHRKLRAHPKAIAVLEPVAAKCTDPEVRAKALFTLGTSKSIVQGAGAVEPWLKLVKEQPGHPLADDALFGAAEALAKAGATDAAIERFDEVVARDPQGEFAGEALFRLYLIKREAKQRDEAMAILEELGQRFSSGDESFERERAAYWLGVELKAAGRQAEALDTWATLSTEHPTTYYGLIARRRIGEVDPKRAEALEQAATSAGRSEPFPRFAGPVAKEPGYRAAVELLRLGFTELVPTELLAIDRTQLPGDSLRLMVLILAQAGEERPAHGMARLWLKRDLTGPITADNRVIWEIAYPRAYRELVEKAAKDADGLDPDLLQALMREESALDPKILSWAGALGLTQLMPATAAQVAAQLKLKRPSTADLLEPELNLKLGGRYLADVLKRAKGTAEYALAGYNAGEGSVKRWKAERPDAPLDEWVERIPLQETRNYVKRVLRSYTTYRLVYAPAAPPPPAAKSAAR
ncbi:MAG: transglycosylase SLT domain-containing protein [Myxococcaceae bacterium]|nr:transglycosylase SLT domain-containing protein [Myxococcaceae bacterium]